MWLSHVISACLVALVCKLVLAWLPWNVILLQRNWNLFSVNVAMAGTGLYQLSRKIRFVPKPSQQVLSCCCWYAEWRTWFTYRSPLQARLLFWWEGCCSTTGSIDNDNRQRIMDWEVCSLGVYSAIFLGRQGHVSQSRMGHVSFLVLLKSWAGQCENLLPKKNPWSYLLCIFLLWGKIHASTWFICYPFVHSMSQSLIWEL